jgi:hypothetical protein
MAQNDTLTGKEIKLLEALLGGASVTDAAADIGVSRRTAYRMVEAPLFVSEWRRAQDELIDLAGRRLAALACTAVDALADVINEPSQRGASNKRLAAVAVLSALHEWRELVDVERRLSELEFKYANER